MKEHEHRGGDSTQERATEQSERLAPPRPRIYVASLSDYNNGVLHGKWIDAAQEAEEIQTEISRMLAASPTMRELGDPAEESAIHDHEDFAGFEPGEYEDLETVSRVARGLAEHGEAFGAYVSWA